MPPISSHKKAYVRMAASLIKPRSVKTKGNKTLQAVIFKHSPLATKLLNQAGKHQEPEIEIILLWFAACKLIKSKNLLLATDPKHFSLYDPSVW